MLDGRVQPTVLLKNNGILPLNANGGQSIAVIGVDGSSGAQTIGGGSGTVTSTGTYTPLYSIQQRLAGTSDTVTYNDGTSQASAVAAANPHTIVVLNDNAAILMPWLNQVAGVFEGFYDGQEWGQAIAALLFGDVNPSGKLPITFPTSLSEVPANTAAQWPGTNGQVQYSEGLDVGYRWYDATNVAPLFPFGYGMSYTTFSYSNLNVGALNNGQATVTATVTNTGSRAGSDVAQLYVGDPASAGEPQHQLKGFQRIALNPGASATVAFTVTAHDLASWDSTSNSWIAGAGSYQILVGDSSRNLPLTGSLSVSSPMTANAMS